MSIGTRPQSSRSQTLQRKPHEGKRCLPRRAHTLGRKPLSKNTQSPTIKRDQLSPSSTEFSFYGLSSEPERCHTDIDELQPYHPMLMYRVQSLPLLTLDGSPCPVHHSVTYPSVASLSTMAADKSRRGTEDRFAKQLRPYKPKVCSGKCRGFIAAWIVVMALVLGTLLVTLIMIMS